MAPGGGRPAGRPILLRSGAACSLRFPGPEAPDGKSEHAREPHHDPGEKWAGGRRMVGWLAARSRAVVARALVPLCPACTQKISLPRAVGRKPGRARAGRVSGPARVRPHDGCVPCRGGSAGPARARARGRRDARSGRGANPRANRSGPRAPRRRRGIRPARLASRRGPILGNCGGPAGGKLRRPTGHVSRDKRRARPRLCRRAMLGL
jgi:hypothetical protein